MDDTNTTDDATTPPEPSVPENTPSEIQASLPIPEAPEAPRNDENLAPVVNTAPQIPPSQTPAPSFIEDLLVRARSAIQTRKRKKLDAVMTLFGKRSGITNDEVEKFLHVSDATATRYLSILEKEGKVRQAGRTGKSVSYVKIV